MSSFGTLRRLFHLLFHCFLISLFLIRHFHPFDFFSKEKVIDFGFDLIVYFLHTYWFYLFFSLLGLGFVFFQLYFGLIIRNFTLFFNTSCINSLFLWRFLRRYRKLLRYFGWFDWLFFSSISLLFNLFLLTAKST